MPSPIITLTTDFGNRDSYVGSMKGIILGISPGIRIVDLCHFVTPQDIPHGAFLLHTGYSYFPKGTIHVAVVDPGVGSERRAIAVKTSKYIFIAPDNGLLSYIFRDEKIETIRSIENKSLFLKTISMTFHGRDIFAPVAAHLAKGNSFSEVGPEIENSVQLLLPKPSFTDDQIIAHVVCIDQFGNVITDITRAFWEKQVKNRRFFILCGKRIEKINRSYSESREGEILAIFNSSDYLEISANRGNAAEYLHFNAGSGN